ncbi:uncharacterized protein LOC124932753 [Impatiens glandulifera]|uniref:uncharacterized protein LOC124932753 n=1 Tax=Impatiens glandulifera TaxID=253017 RepID=UPI001FB189BD|nr:uncharacterized protein LOC124932753 [Impatiens glandulifera]
MSTGISQSTDPVQSTVGDSPSENDVVEPSASERQLPVRDSSDADEVPALDESTSGVEDSVGIENESSGIAKALSSMLSSVIRDFDSKAEDASRSQDQLSFSLDRLTQELDQLLEDAPLPFIVQHAVKISGVRRRVSSLNSLLRSIQRRVDNIDRMLSTGSTQETHQMGIARQH